MRARLQAELEAQLSALTESHGQAIDRARQAAEAEAEQKYSTSLQAAREELTARLEAEVAAARKEADAIHAEMNVRLEQEVGAARAETQAVRDELTASFHGDLAAARAESEAARADFDSRLQNEVAAVRSEVERTMIADSMRARVEAEQSAADAVSRTRREMEQALDTERQNAQRQIDDVRRQAHEQVEAERQRAERELAQVRAELEAAMARQHAPLDAAPASADEESGLLEAIRAIDEARTLSDSLVAVVRAAARVAPRAALFMVNGAQLQEWPVPGLPALHTGSMRPEDLQTGVLAEAVRRGEPAMTGRGNGCEPPVFAALPADRTAMAVPFVLAGTPVAVLYADEGTSGEARAAWSDRVQILGRHASAYLAYVTAMRTAQALRLLSGPPSGGDAGHGAQSDAEHEGAQGARRYARLLVSEIKLYNESAVRLGRERRDLLQRLKPEIDRARRFYDERVAPSIRSRDAYFHQELVETLADGDHSLLG